MARLGRTTLFCIISDLDKAYQRDFVELVQDLGIMQIPAAPEAHWQMGKVERKMGFF